MKLSIVTVTWNSQAHIAAQIASVAAAAGDMPFEHIIVDNASQDSTVEVIRKYSHVRCIVNTQNRGFGAANNQGVEIASGEYVLFLNPDMKLSPNTLPLLIAWMESQPDIGAAGVKLTHEDGSLNAHTTPRRFPRLRDQLVLLLKLPHLFPSVLDSYLMKGFDSEKEQDVDSIRGSFMLVRRSVIQKLGWAFDPRYFIWFEEVDLCREIHRMGLRVVYTPAISAVDYVGQGFKQQATYLKQQRFTQSMVCYFQKWEPWYIACWIILARPIALCMTYAYTKVARTH